MSKRKPPVVSTWKNQGTRTRHGKSWKGDDYWLEFTLQEASKDLPVFDLPIAGIDIGFCPWDLENMEDIVYHFDRISKVDLKYPVILDNYGTLIDGFHRVCRALSEGKRTVKAVRLEYMPPVDGSKEKE